MTSSARTTSMSKPVEGKKVADWTLAYFRQRNRNHVHSLVIKAMKKFNVSQAEIARRLGRRPDVVCRWIGAPGNWTLDTVSDLLFAINGLEVAYQTADSLSGSKRNYSSPEWLIVPAGVGKTVSNVTIFPSLIETQNANQKALPKGGQSASASNQTAVATSVSNRQRQLESTL